MKWQSEVITQVIYVENVNNNETRSSRSTLVNESNNLTSLPASEPCPLRNKLNASTAGELMCNSTLLTLKNFRTWWGPCVVYMSEVVFTWFMYLCIPFNLSTDSEAPEHETPRTPTSQLRKPVYLKQFSTPDVNTPKRARTFLHVSRKLLDEKEKKNSCLTADRTEIETKNHDTQRAYRTSEKQELFHKISRWKYVSMYILNPKCKFVYCSQRCKFIHNLRTFNKTFDTFSCRSRFYKKRYTVHSTTLMLMKSLSRQCK